VIVLIPLATQADPVTAAAKGSALSLPFRPLPHSFLKQINELIQQALSP
jgi:hypothetical protein